MSTTTEFIAHVKQMCKLHGVKCDLRNSTYIKYADNIKCAGMFDSDNKLLVAAMKRPDALEILAHEYSHMTQWIDVPDWFNQMGEDALILDDWLGGKDIPMPKVLHAIKCARDVELDNEKRTVKIIKEYNLPIDIDTYIRKANSYIIFYNYLAHSRKWSDPKNPPYKNKRILEACSTKFNMKYDSLTPKMLKLFKEEQI